MNKKDEIEKREKERKQRRHDGEKVKEKIFFIAIFDHFSSAYAQKVI